MRIVLDTAILVRATEVSQGPARSLLLNIVKTGHTLLLSNELLYELGRVLRYPRLEKLYGLSEQRVYEFITFLRDAAEIVPLSPLLVVPIRDLGDIIVLQTAVVGDADILCTRDEDFYAPPAFEFLTEAGIEIVDDVTLLNRLRSRTRI